MQYLKDDIRKKILSSALIEFKDKGYLDASMRIIASKSGIALGSTYRYFENKESLFNTLIEPVYDKLLLYLVKIQVQVNTCTGENCTEVPAYIMNLLNKILEFVEESSSELVIIFNKSKGSKFENFKNELTSLVYDIYIKSIDSNLREDDDTKIVVHTISHDLIEGIAFILNQEYDGNKIKILIDKLVYFYITDIDKRFKKL
ncbi:TetR/AcrR family transcriptional regulator [Clostridium hydrogenum]|uniref:TetR/AcrR family transcriptional regulator n=1 Tax=Clostridium hydrogenum TaxID=2855764 RepID=UPI001F4377B5|nr:TetR/AcrR family transcriptional regulator [Clostridium hydrogenum]